MPKRRYKKRKKQVIQKRDLTLIESEIFNNFGGKIREDLTLRIPPKEHPYLSYIALDKWQSIPDSRKQAIRYHQRKSKVFSLSTKVKDFLIPKTIYIENIDFGKLPNLPSAFVIDLSEGSNMFAISPNRDIDAQMDITEIYNSCCPHSLNSCLVYFEKDNALGSPQSFDKIVIVAKYVNDPLVENIDEDPVYQKWARGGKDLYAAKQGVRHLLFDCEDAFSVSQDPTLKDGDTDYEIETIEEIKLAEIDSICEEMGILESAREVYSDAYIRVFIDNFILDTDQFGNSIKNLLSEREILEMGRKVLLSPIISNFLDMEKHEKLRMARMVLTNNLVLAFLKALSEEVVVSNPTHSVHPMVRNRKSLRGQPNNNPYSYITIDADRLVSFKRKRKQSVRRSDRYQTEVEATTGARWVTDEKLGADEEIYDLKESTKTGKILYKVRRPVRSYVRNGHLPKRKAEDNSPLPKVTKVRNIR